MKLKVQFLQTSTGYPAAVLHSETAKKIGAHAGCKIRISTLFKQAIVIIEIRDELVEKNEIGFPREMPNIGFKNNQKIEVKYLPVFNTLKTSVGIGKLV